MPTISTLGAAILDVDTKLIQLQHCFEVIETLIRTSEVGRGCTNLVLTNLFSDSIKNSHTTLLDVFSASRALKVITRGLQSFVSQQHLGDTSFGFLWTLLNSFFGLTNNINHLRVVHHRGKLNVFEGHQWRRYLRRTKLSEVLKTRQETRHHYGGVSALLQHGRERFVGTSNATIRNSIVGHQFDLCYEQSTWQEMHNLWMTSFVLSAKQDIDMSSNNFWHL